MKRSSKYKSYTSSAQTDAKTISAVYSWLQFRSQFLYHWKQPTSSVSVSLLRKPQRYHALWESPESPQSPWIQLKEEDA